MWEARRRKTATRALPPSAPGLIASFRGLAAIRLVMQRNERLWGAQPAWDTVTFRYVRISSSRLATLLAGDAT